MNWSNPLSFLTSWPQTRGLILTRWISGFFWESKLVLLFFFVLFFRLLLMNSISRNRSSALITINWKWLKTSMILPLCLLFLPVWARTSGIENWYVGFIIEQWTGSLMLHLLLRIFSPYWFFFCIYYAVANEVLPFVSYNYLQFFFFIVIWICGAIPIKFELKHLFSFFFLYSSPSCYNDVTW